MEPTNNEVTQTKPIDTTGTSQAEEVVKKPITPFNKLVLVFVGMIVISWFFPVASECGGRGGPGICDYQIPSLLSVPLLLMAIIVGIIFLIRTVANTKGQSIVVQIVFTIIGLAGGAFIFIVGAISALIGSTRVNGSV